MVIAEPHRKGEERFYIENEAVKNIVIVIWVDMETEAGVWEGSIGTARDICFVRIPGLESTKSEYMAGKLPLKIW